MLIFPRNQLQTCKLSLLIFIFPVVSFIVFATLCHQMIRIYSFHPPMHHPVMENLNFFSSIVPYYHFVRAADWPCSCLDLPPVKRWLSALMGVKRCLWHQSNGNLDLYSHKRDTGVAAAKWVKSWDRCTAAVQRAERGLRIIDREQSALLYSSIDLSTNTLKNCGQFFFSCLKMM